MSCPSGFLCINLNTIIILLVLVFVFFLYIYNHKNKIKYIYKKKKNKEFIKKYNYNDNYNNTHNYLVKSKRILDPLEPPQRSDPHHHYSFPIINRVGIPINIPTRGHSGPFQQVGILTRKNEGQDPLILPLYGKPTYPGSNQWLYYTSSDSYNAMKLPITHNNKDCQKEYGCKEIYNDDVINIPSYEGSFTASIYELDAPRYIPYVY